ncbi:MAG: tripartite tricarboxylate transporter substrate binding protein [bacterium]|jgi:tripartite-type tricarboxylate transporter receptor subunit TctC|nr:tripartite tricarboxylate transporter substrate binding protein [Betaproteobacteria bacterium]
MPACQPAPGTTPLALPASLALALLSAPFVDAHAQAGVWPERPLRLIVPNPAGGGADIIGRLVGQQLGERLRQPVVVENRPGAGGTIGMAALAKSPADGYALAMGVTATLAIAPALYDKAGYDVEKDIEPVALMARLPLILAVHPSLPVKSVEELLRLARQRPGQVAYSSAGNGTPPHLAAELFKTAAKVDFLHVPFKGAAPAVGALVAGEVSLMFANALPAQPHVRSGRLRGLAVTSAQRSSAFPDLPSVAEAGLRDYSAVQWYGVVGPARTPRPIVSRLNQEINAALQVPDVRAPLLAEGADITTGTPEQFRAFVRDEGVRWGGAVRRSGARID